jgi:hypothetical protein
MIQLIFIYLLFKRRKLNNQAIGVVVSISDSKIIFENYIKILSDSLTKKQVEEAMDQYKYIF